MAGYIFFPLIIIDDWISRIPSPKSSEYGYPMNLMAVTNHIRKFNVRRNTKPYVNFFSTEWNFSSLYHFPQILSGWEKTKLKKFWIIQHYVNQDPIWICSINWDPSFALPVVISSVLLNHHHFMVQQPGISTHPDNFTENLKEQINSPVNYRFFQYDYHPNQPPAYDAQGQTAKNFF